MKAQYKGSICQKCKKEIEINQEIEKNNSSWAHAKCLLLELEKLQNKPEEKKPEVKEMKLNVKDPFNESDLIIGILKDLAYKMVVHSKGITDFSILKSKPEEFKSFNIDVMHTEKLFLECILRLREINGIKSEYAKK